MPTIESGLLQDINALAARIVDVRAADARRGAAQIKVLTLELRVKWDELRAARVAAYGPDLRAFLPEGYHASDGRQYRSRLTSVERGALPRNASN
jgi:hypothetical protein